MSKHEEYVKVEKDRIAELIAKIDDLWILSMIYRCILNVTRGTKYDL